MTKKVKISTFLLLSHIFFTKQSHKYCKIRITYEISFKFSLLFIKKLFTNKFFYAIIHKDLIFKLFGGVLCSAQKC